MKQFLLLSSLAALVLTSCNGIFGKPVRGNGHVITENRNPGSFRNVEVSGNIDIYPAQDSTTSVKVVADENLMKYIRVELDGNTLSIHPEDGYELHASNGGIKVYVNTSHFSEFHASGSCDIKGMNQIQSDEKISFHLSGSCDVDMDVKAPKVDADLSGSGTIKLSGATKDFSVDGSGSTDVKCYDLLTENSRIGISGSGDAEVYASVKLDVSVSGSASVRFKGNAAVSQSVSGSGSVKKVD